MKDLKLADRLFSLLVRTWAGWCCEYCQKDFSSRKHELECSHFWPRRHKGTRYDRENCDSLCHECHQWFHTATGRWEYERWKKKLLGEERFEALAWRARAITKLTEKRLAETITDFKYQLSLTKWTALPVERGESLPF